MKTLILDRHDIAAIVAVIGIDSWMDLMIDRLQAAFVESLHGQRYDFRPRDGFQHTRPHPGLLEWMPCLERGRYATLKMVGYNPINPERGLPTIMATTSVHEVLTGHLVALVDAVFLTALRTGAASAIATRVLAHPESRVLGVVGAGAQAVTQVHGISRVRPIDTVLVHDIDGEVARSLRRRLSFHSGLRVHAVPLDVLEREADILCTATSVAVGAGPVIGGESLREHVHVNAVGSDLAGKTELPLPLLLRSLVVPDFRAQAVKEGECQQMSPQGIGPELAEVMAAPERFRRYQAAHSVFDSTGHALEDHVAAELTLELASRYRRGKLSQIETCPADPRMPYPPRTSNDLMTSPWGVRAAPGRKQAEV